jgi:hypothetical protein
VVLNDAAGGLLSLAAIPGRLSGRWPTGVFYLGGLVMRTKVMAALASVLMLACVARADTYSYSGNCVKDSDGTAISGLVVEVTFIFPDGNGSYNTWNTWCYTDASGDWACDFGPTYGGSDVTVLASVVPKDDQHARKHGTRVAQPGDHSLHV